MTRGCTYGQWQDGQGVVHEYVALKTEQGRYHVGTVCLMYEDMYMSRLPPGELVVTCLTCLCDPNNLLKGRDAAR